MERGLANKRAAEERRQSELKAQKEAKAKREAAQRTAEANQRLEEARATTSGVHVRWDVECSGRTKRNGRQHVCCDIWTGSPPMCAPQLQPVVLWLHGGGWRHGNHHLMPAFMRALLDAGYAVVSVGYEKREPFPANLDDCKSVARWVRAQGAALGLDGRRIGVIGSSAGAHLAALLGMTGDVESGMPLVGEESSDSKRSSAVQAVVAIAGPHDLRRSCRSHTDPKSHEALLLGGPLDAQPPERIDAASPLAHAKALRQASIVPPFLLIHGDEDSDVPLEQSQLLLAALAEASGRIGVDELVIICGGAHMLFSQVNQAPTIDDTVKLEWDAALHERTLAFLNVHLRGPLPA